jgi:hypothetical protein
MVSGWVLGKKASFKELKCSFSFDVSKGSRRSDHAARASALGLLP